ncbi:MAG TPA: hypothetical protein VN836_02350 [Verrucomicrobiae bacterium]|nr:hypothetical protein [Verrucomicrobiae bacterium]
MIYDLRFAINAQATISLTADYADGTDERNPRYPCHPQLNFVFHRRQFFINRSISALADLMARRILSA